jgi:cytochrome c peroxidase
MERRGETLIQVQAFYSPAVCPNLLRINCKSTLAGVVVAVAAIAGAACHSEKASAGRDRPIGKPITIAVPLGLPGVPVPGDNPETAEAVSLGRRLFYEKKLSSDNSLSCASCHNPTLGFTDRQKHSTGFKGQVGKRNAPTVMNAAYLPFQFWDGRAGSLEDQAAGPIANPIEMNQKHDVCVSKLAADPTYKAEFRKVFGPGEVTIGKIEKAIASFERTLISGDSPFDRYQFGGDKTALSPAAIRGLAIFRDSARADCAACHTIDDHFALFTDGKFHNIGIGVDDEGNLTDLGRYNETKAKADTGAFLTPTLRNVAMSAPYTHDGSLKTLRDVVDYYAGGGNSNPYLDKKIKPLNLSGRERDDLVKFLESLTGQLPNEAGPPPAAQTGRTE